MSDEKQLCECGCGNPADWEVYMEGPCYGAKISRACVGYHESSDVKWDATMDRIRSRRSKPAAKELEPIERFRIPRNTTIRRSKTKWGPYKLTEGDEVEFMPASESVIRGNSWATREHWLIQKGFGERNGPFGAGVEPDVVPEVHAVLTALRDSTAPPAKTEPEAFKVGDRVQLRVRDYDMREACGTAVNVMHCDSTVLVAFDLGGDSWYPMTDLERIPPTSEWFRPSEPEALRGLAEAFTCDDCGARTPAHRGAPSLCEKLCVYCATGSSEPEKGRPSAVHLMTDHPPPAPERAPWDWIVSDGPWDGTP